MTRPCSLRALALGLLIVGMVGCRPGQNESSSEFPRSETLYMAGRQWGEPSSFNPLVSAPDFPVGPDRSNLLYEQLFMYDPGTAKLVGLLAESYVVTDDAIEVMLRPDAHWSDGKPVTGYDVQYSFEIAKKYKSLQNSSIWQFITSVTLPEVSGVMQPASAGEFPRKVVFALDKERQNPLQVLDVFTTMRIIPRHFIEPILEGLNGDIEAFNKLKFDKDYVSSGPYRLYSYSSEKIVLLRDDNYWGNKALHGGKLPAPKFIVHPMFKASSHYSVALQQGQLDMSATFIPRIWLKEKKGVHAWFDKPPFFAPVCITQLFINHKRAPLDDVHFRRAMAFAINYDDIRELALTGYADPHKPGLVMPFGVESKYYSDEDAEKVGTWYDPARAMKELEAGGYKPVFDAKGELESTLGPSGNPIQTIYIKSPTGWSDWEQVVHIAVKSLRKAGIDARERFVDGSIFFNMWFTGDFDLLMMTPSGPPTPSKPWSRFDSVLTTREFYPVGGGKMYANQGRFNDPKGPNYMPRFDELLGMIPKLKDEKALGEAYRELNRLFMEQQPTIPVFFRPEWFYEYSEKVWTGYPTAKDPYLPPNLPDDGLGTQLLWQIRLARVN
jgi:peptide/nickel transport system substrate-binding protein